MGHFQEADALRARFTVFLQVMVRRARLNYLATTKKHRETISMENLPERPDPAAEIELPGEQGDFSFENERLSQAFAELPPGQQTVLRLLFVDALTPREIAGRLGCTVGHVYNQRSLALKRLRQQMGGGKHNG